MFHWFKKDYTNTKNLDEIAKQIVNLFFMARILSLRKIIDREESRNIAHLMGCSVNCWVYLTSNKGELNQEELDLLFDMLSAHLRKICAIINSYPAAGVEIKAKVDCEHIREEA